MKRESYLPVLAAALCLLLFSCAPKPRHFELGGNPIITHMYSADPSAHVFGDSLYVYPSHDRDEAHGFDMEDYHVYVTGDMKTFEDRGVIFRPFEQTSWATKNAWAPDCVERGGKYYFYFPTDVKYIGVAVSDSPYGPFEDPLGHPLLTIDSPGVICDRDFIDPCVFIDDDGQAYMFVGQNTCCCIKLNDDMISYDGEVHIIEGLEDRIGCGQGDSEAMSFADASFDRATEWPKTGLFRRFDPRGAGARRE